jgi:hypothetical protein
VNDELERVLKEVFMAYFKVLCQHMPGGTEESHKDLKFGPLEHTAGV